MSMCMIGKLKIIRLYSLRNKKNEKNTSVSLVQRSSKQIIGGPEKFSAKTPAWKPVSSHCRQSRSGQEKISETGDSVFKTKSSEPKTSRQP